ncbi:MAG: alpha/beta hydrolase [Betaproteobacteria bacterium]
MNALSAEFVEREYNNRAAFPDHPQWFARWAADSAQSRRQLDGRLDVRYGTGARQTIDLFPAAAPRGALLFIHGGYWRSLDKSDHSFIADPWVERGIGVAVMNYDLCPGVSIPRIVEEARDAVAWLAANGARYAMPTDRLLLAGHSAGGHLVASLLAGRWPDAAGSQSICGAVSISGVFDLEPLLLSSMNADLRLDIATARAMSPVHHPPRVATPLLLAVGADETREFIRQTTSMWEAWPQNRPVGMTGPLIVPHRHHFSVASDLAVAESALFGAALRLFGE